ncbi:AAA family ATPase [bacterium]|nr:AAA family ATPase [bacterium]
MKLNQLELENYGIHIEQTFAFETSSLQVIYGRNEAGKSTLLQAVRELLFGFQHARSNPFAPDSSKKKMKATAQLTTADDQSVTLVRRQGNKNTISGEIADNESQLDEARWQQLISGADQRLYEHVFGFSLKELATGEESLKEANLNEALFGGGLGRLHDYRQLLKDIDEEIDALFKNRGQKQKINAILSDIKGLKADLKNSSLRPADYQQWLSDAERCEAELTRLNAAYDEAFRRQRHLERLKNAHPLWIEQNSLRERLAKLEAPETFPADALEELSQTRRQAAKLKNDVDNLSRDLGQTDANIRSISFNQSLIESGEAIRSLLYAVKEMQGYRRDMPLREQERQKGLADAEANLRRINPKLKLEQVAELQLTLAQRKKIEQLTKTYDRLQTEIASHLPDVERLDQEIRGIESELGQMPEVQNELFEQLRLNLDPLRQSINRQNDLLKQSRKLASDLQKRRMMVEAVTGSQLDFTQPLPLPLEPTIRRYEEELQSLSQQIQSANQAVADTQEQIAAKKEELRRLEQSASLVSQEQLQSARDQRNATWSSIRATLLGKPKETPAEQGRSSADQFEEQVQTTDQLADQRYQHAQMLADHQAMQANIESLQQRLAAREKQLAALVAKKESCLAEWTAEWKPSGITPKSPQEMLPWLATYHSLVDTQAELLRLEEELAPHQQRVERVEVLIAPKASADSMPTPEDTAAWIEDYLNQCQAENQRRSQLTNKLQLNQSARQSAFDRNEKRQQELEAIEAQANQELSLLECLGDIDLKTAAELIQTVDNIQAALREAHGLQKRITDMRSGLEQFAEQVATVVTATGETLGDMPPETAVQRLGTLLNEAERLKTSKTELEIKRGVQADSLAKSQRELHEVETRLADWRKQIEVETDDQLEVISQTVRQQQSLEAGIVELDSKLAIIRGTEDAEKFAAQLADLDLDQLELEFSNAKNEYAEIGQIQAEANQQLGELKHRLREVDQTSRSVLAQGKIEALQSELSDCLDRYGPLLIAREMLDRAMQAFREESSGPLLVLISELIERMTEGRYTKVEHDPDQEGGLILSGPNDLVRKPSVLSTGTREQLYLAIRLAYIRHYCQSAEPLPVLMDDILVNFDDQRQLATLRVLVDFDPRIQIILLTCHEPLVAKAHTLGASASVCHIDGAPVKSTLSGPKSARKKSSAKSSTPSLFENA